MKFDNINSLYSLFSYNHKKKNLLVQIVSVQFGFIYHSYFQASLSAFLIVMSFNSNEAINQSKKQSVLINYASKESA